MIVSDEGRPEAGDLIIAESEVIHSDRPARKTNFPVPSWHDFFDVSEDGQQFLILKPTGPPPEIVVAQNLLGQVGD